MITVNSFKKYLLFHRLLKNNCNICYNCSYIDDATCEVRVEDAYVGKTLVIIIKGFLKGRLVREIDEELLISFFKYHDDNANIIGLCWDCELA